MAAGDFTLSYHFFHQRDSRNHLELFLDVDGQSALETWRCFKTPRAAQGRVGENVRRFSAAPPHRRAYLAFSGVISQNRGKLRILRKGKFIDHRTAKSVACAAYDVHSNAGGRTETAAAIKVTL